MLGVIVHVTLTLFELQKLRKRSEICSWRLKRSFEPGFKGFKRPTAYRLLMFCPKAQFLARSAKWD